MKIQIAIAGDDNAKLPETTDMKPPEKTAPSEAGSYKAWETRMRNNPNFKEFKRLDANKMAAYDAGGKLIESYIIDSKKVWSETDTLDSKQGDAPINKTQNDVRTDAMQEKGA